jgi:hypothetical protein
MSHICGSLFLRPHFHAGQLVFRTRTINPHPLSQPLTTSSPGLTNAVRVRAVGGMRRWAMEMMAHGGAGGNGRARKLCRILSNAQKIDDNEVRSSTSAGCETRGSTHGVTKARRGSPSPSLAGARNAIKGCGRSPMQAAQHAGIGGLTIRQGNWPCELYSNFNVLAGKAALAAAVLHPCRCAICEQNQILRLIIGKPNKGCAAKLQGAPASV